MNKNVKGLLKQSFVRNMEHRGGRTFLKLRTKGVSLFLSLSLSLSLFLSLFFEFETKMNNQREGVRENFRRR